MEKILEIRLHQIFSGDSWGLKTCAKKFWGTCFLGKFFGLGRFAKTFFFTFWGFFIKSTVLLRELKISGMMPRECPYKFRQIKPLHP